MGEDDTGRDSLEVLQEKMKQRGMKATSTFHSVKKQGTLSALNSFP